MRLAGCAVGAVVLLDKNGEGIGRAGGPLLGTRERKGQVRGEEERGLRAIFSIASSPG